MAASNLVIYNEGPIYFNILAVLADALLCRTHRGILSLDVLPSPIKGQCDVDPADVIFLLLLTVTAFALPITVFQTLILVADNRYSKPKDIEVEQTSAQAI